MRSTNITIFEKGEFAPATPCWMEPHFSSFSGVSTLGSDSSVDHARSMLTEIYIEALLVDEALADQVYELWDAGIINDELADIAWCIISDI
jgi:hypothetical protein